MFEEQLSFTDAKKRLEGILADTKLIPSPVFSEKSGNEVYIKPENLQVTGAFKIRGAFNKVSKLSEEEKSKGIITASAGNHAQGVAYAAQKLGVKATICMPETTPLIKVNATKSYGVDVVLHGECFDDAYAKACELEKEHGYTFIHPFNDLDVIEGQGTISLEILEELEDADCIIVPIGGGGLISGVAIAAKTINPNIKIIGVEPEEAQSMKESIEKDEIITLDTVNTIADGTAVKTPGDLNFSIVKKYVDEIVTVSDYEVMDAFLILTTSHKIIAENSGSLSLAALNKIQEKNKKVVCLISGGNIDILSISDLINQGLVYAGRIFCFSVNVVDKPGELHRISDALAKLDANIISVEHHSRRGKNIFMDVNLEIAVETNGHSHIEYITNELTKQGYEISKIY